MPQRRLSITQVISLNLLRFTIHVKDLNVFHRIVKAMDLIPDMPNYENFLIYSHTSEYEQNYFLEYHQTRAIEGFFVIMSLVFQPTS